MERYYPTEEQLFGLYRFLTMLKNDKLYWIEIKPNSGRIMVKTEPLKGEIDIRVFYVQTNGKVDDDGFGEDRLL